MKQARETYDKIEIPEELYQVVNQAIENSGKSRKSDRGSRGNRGSQGMRILRWGSGIAASFVLATVIGLNTSQSFAMEVQQLPVIGPIARVLTVRNYNANENGILVEGKVAEVLTEDGEGMAAADRINQEIQKMCDAYVSEAQVRAEEYRQAFLDTGGTEEEWAAHNIEIHVDYDIKSQSDAYLSFVVNGTENWSSAGSFTKYYNLDLKTWNYVTLEDLLGLDYKKLANESIRNQMEENRRKDTQLTYWTEAEGGFTGIDENTMYYINEQGNPVVMFGKYEIGPGSLGMPEFEIVKENER